MSYLVSDGVSYYSPYLLHDSLRTASCETLEKDRRVTGDTRPEYVRFESMKYHNA